ncbi:MAG: class I SAM-dependent methyltransferase [Bacteroidetes bacterium]|nr:class I SAM-dependent methyltransferase [Bacteroidota bacterium]
MKKRTHNKNISCPICSNTTIKVKKLDSPYIIDRLALHFNTQVDKNLNIVDYELLKCTECSFEFSYPQIAGSGAFYNWITSQTGYYPKIRWEFSKVLDLLANEKKGVKLLDVGCGDGQFFDQIVKKKNTKIDFYGLDPTIGSIEMCIDKGYKVYCMDIKEFKINNKNTLFDAVTLYHVLEHIANPKEFIEELLSLLNPNGSIYISTPYSPMDFELDWFDVLNHPPHHFGRWNLKSYKKLAEVLGLKIEVFMPLPGKLLVSAIQSFMFSIYGNLGKGEKKTIIKSIIKTPFKFLTHLWKQSQRDKIMGKRAANVILAKFTK